MVNLYLLTAKLILENVYHHQIKYKIVKEYFKICF